MSDAYWCAAFRLDLQIPKQHVVLWLRHGYGAAAKGAFLDMFIKLLFIFIGVALWLFTQMHLGKRKVQNGQEIFDWVHEWTKSLHRKIHGHEKAAHFFLISSSLLIDGVGVYILYSGLMGPSFEPVLALFMVFILRQANQAITTLPPPKDMIWRNPGVPSIFVTYGVSNDLFFSGHTALAVLGCLELSKLGPMWMLLAIAIALYEVIVVLILRAHWTMDIFTGAVTALYVHYLAEQVSPFVDAWLNSMH